eukprot:11911943-Alexandrium_andersonii.AAC.1
MSASLVGSEMCIRDSPTRPRCAPRAGHHDWVGTAPAPTESLPAEKPCGSQRGIKCNRPSGEAPHQPN